MNAANAATYLSGLPSFLAYFGVSVALLLAFRAALRWSARQPSRLFAPAAEKQ